MSASISVTKADYRALLEVGALISAEMESGEWHEEMWGPVDDQLDSLRGKIFRALNRKGEFVQ